MDCGCRMDFVLRVVAIVAGLAACASACSGANAGATADLSPIWSPEAADPHLCFAYSTQEHRYACTLFEAVPSTGHPSDVASEEIATSFTHARDLSAELMLGVRLTGNDLRCRDPSGEQSVLFVQFDEWHTGCDEQSVVTETALADILQDRGYNQPVTRSSDLPAGEWVTFGEAELRYSVELTEGSASFEYWGKLEIHCTSDGQPLDVFTDLLADAPDAPHLGGPLARISTAEDTTFRALSIEFDDGGEGYVDVSWQHWVFDENAYCR